MRGIERLLEPPLEFAPVDEAGQRVMGGLVTHLARETAQLADVVEDDDGSGNGVAGAAYGRCGELDRVLLLLVFGDHDGAPAHVHTPAHREAAFHRIPERAAIRVVHQREQVGYAPPGCLLPANAGQGLGSNIHVIDTPALVGRNDALCDRLERVLGLAL
jgi:hypothetical protein